MNLFTELRPEWHDRTPKRLLDAPPVALKALDSAGVSALEEVLTVTTLRGMVSHPLVEWVWRTHGRFRAGLIDALPDDAAEHLTDEWCAAPVADWLDAPLTSLRALTPEQARRLTEVLGWHRVRQMATDGAFAAAREVHRIVTGGPLSPEQTAPRPLKNYFAGATSRFLARQREEAGGSAQRSPTATPQAPGMAPPAGITRERPMADESAASVSARLRPKQGTHVTRAGRRQRRDYTPTGAYIPLGGGSRGWLDNAGVARTELANDYRFHEAVDENLYRRGRSTAGSREDLRDSGRVDMRLRVLWTESETAEPTRHGLCLDLSLGGARLRFVGLSRRLPIGQPLHVVWIYRGEQNTQDWPVLDLHTRVVRCEEENEGGSESVFDIGLAFGGVSTDTERRIRLLLSGRAEVLQRLREPAQPSGRG